MSREVYVKGPKEGLPPVKDKDGKTIQQRLAPFSLLELIKGAYGLTEAPRLWYLRARKLLTQIGFEELKCARAVFTYRAKGALVAMLTLHVDDGLVYGDPKNNSFQMVKDKINGVLDIK